MASAIDRCKRALVTLLQTFARLYGCRVTVTRDSPDDVVKRAYRTVSKKPIETHKACRMQVVWRHKVHNACAKSDLVRFDVTGQFMGALLVCLPGGARNFSPQALWGAQQSFPQVGVC